MKQIRALQSLAAVTYGMGINWSQIKHTWPERLISIGDELDTGELGCLMTYCRREMQTLVTWYR